MSFRAIKAQLLFVRKFQHTIFRNMATKTPYKYVPASQKYDYFLVLDFEATCEKNSQLEPQEIIEFPVLKVNGKTFEVESTFHQYVCPQVWKDLSSFCTELTGIIQEMVEGQPDIATTLQNFDKWMSEEGLLREDTKSIFVTCGDWDLKSMLPKQCTYFGLAYPEYLTKWINIKKPYTTVMKTFPKGMMAMLHQLKLTHVGRHHSGIDDCKNIANILKALGDRGHIFEQTGQR